MSLVGTRPPTVDEWDKYELHHRARLATKPGLTGMWQVSGRSNITDFEEVVKLDKQYKRLEAGKFQWPRTESEVRSITSQQFRWLMEGLTTLPKKQVKRLKKAPDYTV